MRTIVLGVGAVAFGFMLGSLSAQDFEPSCKMCPSTYVTSEELDDYLKVGREQGAGDQQVRSVNIGKTNLQIARAYRGRLDKPGGVAVHDLVTEVYIVTSGSGTNVTGPDVVNAQRRPATNNAVRMLNGPGRNADAIRNGATQQLKAGDVLVIPAGTGHQFTRIEDHISYIMIRVDPDKVVPLMNDAASKAYLAGKRKGG